MSNKKGITVISTLIIVVVITVLAGTIAISTSYIIRNTYEKEFIREYKLVEAATKDYIMRNSGQIDFDETTFDLSTVDSKNVAQFSGETSVDNIIEMYIIDLEKIGVTNTTYGVKENNDENDVYLLSKSTNTVYYKKGFETDNTIYYKVIFD